MKLTTFSEQRLRRSLSNYSVYGDFADPLYNYLVHGYYPGGFFSGVLANDYVGAMSRCHPGNHIEYIKALCSWLVNCCPESAWGGHQTLRSWCDADPEERRAALEAANLIFTEEQEVYLILRGEPVTED